MTDPSGRVVIVHGFNLVVKVAPYEPATAGFNAADAAFLQEHGFDAVRLGVIPQGVEPAPGRIDSAYLDSIASTVDLLSQHGIYSLLDFHQDLYNQQFQGEGLPSWMVDDDGLPAEPQAGFPGNYFAMPALWRAYDHLWANTAGPQGIGFRDWYDVALSAVAARFKGVPAVLGYDVFNEPYPGSDYAGCFPPQGCPVADRTQLAPFMAAAVAAVHREDPTHVAFVEPWLAFDYSAPTYLGQVGSGPVGFSFHAYCLAALGTTVPDSGPPRTGCNHVEQTVFANAESQAAAGHQVPLLTEFGATADQTELSEVVSLADADRVGWLEWAFCDCGDPTGSGQAEALVYDLNRPPTGANVDQASLSTLDEPYPMVVAGTPGSYGYDPANGTFKLTYITRGPAGRRLAGAVTEVHVPLLHYPHGYAVSVDGATVVSPPGAATLLLRNDTSSAQVALVIIPKA